MTRLPNYYKNRVTGYPLAYESLCKTYLKIKKPLTLNQATESLENTSGLSFSTGTRTEDILKTLEGWKLITKFIPVGQKEAQFVPLEWRVQ